MNHIIIWSENIFNSSDDIRSSNRNYHDVTNSNTTLRNSCKAILHVFSNYVDCQICVRNVHSLMISNCWKCSIKLKWKISWVMVTWLQFIKINENLCIIYVSSYLKMYIFLEWLQMFGIRFEMKCCPRNLSHQIHIDLSFVHVYIWFDQYGFKIVLWKHWTYSRTIQKKTFPKNRWCWHLVDVNISNFESSHSVIWNWTMVRSVHTILKRVKLQKKSQEV